MIKLCGLYAFMNFFFFFLVPYQASKIHLLCVVYKCQRHIGIQKKKKKLANAESASSIALGWIVLDQTFELDLVLIMVLGLK